MHTILHTARLHARAWEQQQLSYSSTGSSNDSSDNNDKGNSGNIGSLQWLQWQHTTMHTILHTARPHAHTWEQQQTSNGSNSSNSNSIDGSGGNDTDNSGAVGSPQWLQWQHSTVSDASVQGQLSDQLMCQLHQISQIWKLAALRLHNQGSLQHLSCA